MSVKVRLITRCLPDTPMGIPNGRLVYHAEQRDFNVPTSLVGRGCVLGRGATVMEAVHDFVRRAQADGGRITLNDVEWS